jgi:hypothetical protein
MRELKHKHAEERVEKSRGFEDKCKSREGKAENDNGEREMFTEDGEDRFRPTYLVSDKIRTKDAPLVISAHFTLKKMFTRQVRRC